MDKRFTRVNVIGMAGSGKSSFAKTLALKMNAPYIEMDALFWQNDWVQSSDFQFEASLKEALKGDLWVLDGSYSRTQPIKWERVTSIIWLDLPFYQTLWNVTKRCFQRSIKKERLWGTNNFETFCRTFISKDSLILWVLKNYHPTRKRNLALMNEEKYHHIHFVHLRSFNAMERFLFEVSHEKR